MREAPGGAAHVIMETTSSTSYWKILPYFYEDKTKKPTSYEECIVRY